MSSIDNQASWKEVCKKRVLINRILSIGLTTAVSFATLLFLVMYHYSFYVIAPIMLIYWTMGYLGMVHFVGMWFGFYAALQPIEKDKYHPVHQAKELTSDVRIAIILPIYHENVRRISAAVCAMIEDLSSHEEYRNFDFFILSDSRKIDIVSQEMFSVEKMREIYPHFNIIYRHRIYNGEAKIGNISDFIKRFSPNYKFMMMLDADSIVPAKSMIDIAKMMNGNDKIGIIQSGINMVMRNTLHARLSKFTVALTLIIDRFGQHFFYMGRSFYYGHNAMIRTEAFAKYCRLPILKKKGPWAAGRPISHDYVEAALLDGAGYEIWSLPELESFEELPTNFIDDFQRENRWLYGSMLYLRVMSLTRIDFLYKARLFTSALNYFNPLFGWVMLVIGLYGLIYIFDHPLISKILFNKFRFIFIFSISFLIFSLLSKGIISIIYYHKKRKMYLFNGFVKMTFSYCLYVFFTVLFGPLLMCQMSKMLLFWMMGKKINWGEQNRDDRQLTWSECFSQVGWMSLVGVAILYMVIYHVFSHYTPHSQHLLGVKPTTLLLWYFPLMGGLLLAPAIVRFTSVENKFMAKMKWFSSPQELYPHFVVSRTQELIPYFEKEVPEDMTFNHLINSPWFFFRRLQQLPQRLSKYHFWKDKLAAKKLSELTPREQFVILRCRELWEEFHIRNL